MPVTTVNQQSCDRPHIIYENDVSKLHAMFVRPRYTKFSFGKKAIHLSETVYQLDTTFTRVNYASDEPETYYCRTV